MQLAPGEGFERYVIESLIGRGGMGTVYLARDQKLGRRVALKVLNAELAEDAGFRRRFEDEARIAASLDEPHIVPIYAADEHDGQLYIAMRYVGGFDLDTLLRRHGPLPVERAVRLVEQIAGGLDAAHDAGLIHRDVKPANILVATDPHGVDHAYLTDFGLARSGRERRLTQAGQVVGSLDYIAPEQIDGRPLDKRADVYALGGVLYAALTGEPPFRAATDAGLIYAHLNSAPPVPSASAPGVSRAMDAIVAKAMAKDPADRFPSATDLAQAAHDAQSAPNTPDMPAATIAPPVASGPSTAEAQVRKTVTILFTDLVGSTSIGEQLDPEALRTLMDAYFDEVRAAVEHHGGVLEKFIGDAAVGVFGVPTIHEDDALRAVRAAAEVGQRLGGLSAGLGARLGVEIVPRTGINTGEVVTGTRHEGGPIAIGDAVNTAARLQQLAEPGQILLGEITMRLVRDEVTADASTPLAAKGKERPVVAYLLRDVRRRASSGVRHPETPLIGRGRELELLADRWQQTLADRSPRLVTIVGVAGVGKSKLAYQFAQNLTDARVLTGRCLPYGEGITYWPIREIVQGAAGVTDSDATDIAQARIVELLGRDPQAALLAERVATAIGLLAGSAPQQEIFWAVRRLLEQLGRERPTLVLLEDLHWAEAALLDLVEYVSDLAADSALMLLATSRPELLELRPGWSSGRQNVDLLRLEALPANAARDLVSAQTGGSAIPQKLAERICQTAEGNPLFVQEMVAMLRDDGALHADKGDWRFAGSAERIELPPSIRALLAARIDRLDRPERQVAERASVIGRVFETVALAELLPQAERPEVTPHLRSLVRREILQPDRAELSAGDAFRFRHILVRDAAYESLPKSERAELHRRFAGWLAGVAGDRLPEFAEICGYHLEQAYRYLSLLAVDSDRAAVGVRGSEFLTAAAERADARGEPNVASMLYRRALALRPNASSERAELLVALARVERDRGEFDAARRTIEAAREDARDVDARVFGLRADVETVLLDIQSSEKGTLVHDKESLARVCDELAAAGDDRGLAACRIAEGTIHELEGRNSAAAASFTEALRHASRIGDTRAEIETVNRAVLNLILGETPVTLGIKRCEEALAEWADQPRARAATLDSYASLLAMAGRFDEALAAEQDALRIATEIDDTLAEGLYRAWGMGTILALNGELERAGEEARRGCQLLVDMGARAWLSSVAPIVGEIELALGRVDDAWVWLRQADDVAGDTDIDARTRIDALGARLALRSGDEATALEKAQAAYERVVGSELLYLRGIAKAAQGEVLNASGRVADGRQRLDQAIELHERKGDVARAARVRRIRDQPEESRSVPLV